MTINARALEHALRKMLSSPLEEVRQVGAEIKRVATESVPTLLKYVEPVPYLVETGEDLTRHAGQIVSDAGSSTDWCQLIECDSSAETRVLAAALYRYGQFSYAQAIRHVDGLTPSGRVDLAAALLGRLGRHDIPLREIEFAHYTFDVIIDQGGYFELKRHRMMTQTAQPLTTRLGYATPRRMVSAGMGDLYHMAMRKAAEAYEKLAEFNPHVASYVVPNGYHRRVLLGMNLRSADHFVSLRAAPNAHFSIRRLAYRVGEQIRQATPLLGKYLRVPEGETWQSVEDGNFVV
jgi:thymidylate synthase ThyX